MPGEFVDPTLNAALRVFLAFLHARSVLGKLQAPGAFREVLAGYEILPRAVVPAAAILVMTAEGMAMLAFLIPGYAPLGGAICMTLLLFYSAAISLNLARGRRDIECGCAGPRSRGGGLHEWLVVRNAVYFLFALIASLPVAPREWGALDAFSIAAAAITLALLAMATDGLAMAAARTRNPRPQR